MSRDISPETTLPSNIEETLDEAEQITTPFDPSLIPAEPAPAAPEGGGILTSEELAAAEPPSEQVFITTSGHTRDQRINEVVPGRISILERYWRDADAVTQKSTFRVFTDGLRDAVTFGDTTDENAAVLLFPQLRLTQKIEQLLGYAPANRPVTPEQRKTFLDNHPGATLPKHANQLMLIARAQDWVSNQTNLAILNGTQPPGLVGAAGDFFIKFAASVITNPESLLLAGAIDGAFMGTTLRSWERLLGRAGRPARFVTAKFASGAVFAGTGITFQELQSETFQPLQDLADMARSGWMFTTLEFIPRLAGRALKGPAKKAFDFMKRKHSTMDENDAADINSAFVNQSTRGTDPDMSIPLNKALNDQSIRFQSQMAAEGVSKEDANAILDEGDIELNDDLQNKTRLQDEAEQAFKDANIQPEFAARLTDRLTEIAPDIEGMTAVGVKKESEENTIRRRQIQNQLNPLQKELADLKDAPEAQAPVLAKPLQTLTRSLQDIINQTTDALAEQTELLKKPLRETRRRLKELKTKLANLKRRRTKKEVDLVERIKTEGKKTREDLAAANDLLRELREKVRKEKIKPPVSKKKEAALKRDKIKRLQKPVLEEIKLLTSKLAAIRQPRKIADNATLVRFKAAEIEALLAENRFLFNQQRKLNDSTGLFTERGDILKRLNRLLGKLGIKVEDTPEMKLKAAMNDWSAKNEARRDAMIALRHTELLRHFVNNEATFTKTDLDAFVNQQGPTREPFAADRGKPTPFIAGRDVENATNLLEDRFPPEEKDRIIEEANLTDSEAQEWEALQNAEETRTALRGALEDASRCLLETPQ